MEPVIFRVLGPVGWVVEGQFVTPRSTMVRGLLAILLTQPGQVVATHRLMDALWDTPPDSAEANLRGYVTRLRRALASGQDESVITRRGAGTGGGGGYGLSVHKGECDVYVFRELMSTGRRLAEYDHDGAARTMRRALSLWRSPAGEDLPDTWPLRTLAVGLNAERLSAVEDLAETDLRLGNGHDAAANLVTLLATDPVRERAWALLAQAYLLTRGRAAAFATVAKARTVLTQAVGRHRQAHLDEAMAVLAGAEPAHRG